MRAVGVDPGLEPDPGVAIFRVREPAGNLLFHGVATGHGHVDLTGSGFDRITDRIGANIRRCGTGADQVQFRRRFVEALDHGGGCDIDRCFGGKECVQHGLLRDRHVIAFKPDDLAGPGD